jgi:hypothetical protein
MYTQGGERMKTVTCTDFRKQTSDYISKVEHGETIVLLRSSNSKFDNILFFLNEYVLIKSIINIT